MNSSSLITIQPSSIATDGWEIAWNFWALMGIFASFFIIFLSCYLLIIRIWPCCFACYSTWRVSHQSPKIEV